MPDIRRLIDSLGQLSGTLDDVRPADRAPICEVAGCQVDETWSGSNCTLLADTSDKAYRWQSQQLSVNSGATATATCQLPFAVNVRGGVGVLVKAADLSKLTRMKIVLSENTAANLANGCYSASFYESTNQNGRNTSANYYFLLNDTWAVVWIRRNDFAATGTPTAWGTGATGSVDEYPVATVQLQCVAASGQSPVVHLGGVFCQRFPKAGVVIQYDDGPLTTHSVALPALKRRGWRGCAGIVPYYIEHGDAEYAAMMSVSNLQDLYDAGWDLVCHGYAHLPGVSTTTINDQTTDMVKCQRWLDCHGFTRGSRFLIWPGNCGDNVNHNAVPVVSEMFDLVRAHTHRSSSDGTAPDDEQFAATKYVVADTSSLWIPKDVYNIPYVELSNGIGRIASAEAIIAEAIRDRTVVTVYIHEITDTPQEGMGPWTLTPANHEAILDYIQTHERAGELEVLTMSDWWSRIARFMTPVGRSRSA